MPLAKGKYDNVKIWRPRGTKYSEASTEIGELARSGVAYKIMLNLVVNFAREFGRKPDFDNRCIAVEILFADGKATAALFELPED